MAPVPPSTDMPNDAESEILTVSAMKDLMKTLLTDAVEDIEHRITTALSLKYDKKLTELQQQIKLKDNQFTQLQAELSSLKLKVSTMEDKSIAMTLQCEEFRPVMKAVNTLAEQTEQAERAKRSRNIIVTGIVEAEGETPVSLRGEVQQLLAALHVPEVQVVEVVRLGRRTYADAAAGTNLLPSKARPVVLRLATVADKISLLKGRKNLRDCEQFQRVGVNTDLTREQQANKAAAWPAFMAARKDPKKKCWWVDDTLFIDGKLHKP